MRCRLFVRALLAGCALAALSLAPAAEAQVVPGGFSDTLVASIPSPIGFAFTPNGDILVTTQEGVLNIIPSGTLTPTVAIDFNSGTIPLICTNVERGLLGVAADPNFLSNRFIYLYYTFNKAKSASSQCSQNKPEDPVNRVSRFTLSLSNTVSLSSEKILLDNIPSPNGNHNGGNLRFGKDGNLYISVGDGGCDYKGNSGCAGQNDATLDSHVLLGKILRIAPDGSIPATNPYASTGDSCAMIGTGGTPGHTCKETFAHGLRNPFRMAFDPNAQGTRFYINDVGQNQWEEIDAATSGADYGWNVREGFCANDATSGCNSVPNAVVNGRTDPVFAYKHNSNPTGSPFQGCNSITGGAFVPNGVWPAAYDGAYLFSDYVCGKIFVLSGSGNSFSATSFASGLNGIVDLTFGPYQGGQALYYTNYGKDQLRRIVYSGSANRAPNAVASATPRYGQPPLQVAFSAAGSSDPDGNTLSYSWNFGDQSAAGTGLTVNHTYATSGTYTATLTVSDGQGGNASAQLRIDVGNSPPSVAITSPATDTRFVVGQQITLAGRASDAEDTVSPTLTWEVRQYHVNSSGQGLHYHPYLAPTTAPTVTIQMPGPEDLDAAAKSYFELRLTATDSQGLSTLITQTLRPKIVALSFASQPSGRRLLLNDTTAITTPQTISSWQNYQLSVHAPLQRDERGRLLAVAFWLDDVLGATRSITTPATPTTYTAVFSDAAQLDLSLILR